VACFVKRTGQGSIGEHLAAGLAGVAVIGFAVRIMDALHRVAAMEKGSLQHP